MIKFEKLLLESAMAFQKELPNLLLQSARVCSYDVCSSLLQ